MKALVTGASGFIGRHLVRELSRRGWDIRILIHRNTPEEPTGLELVRGDITDPASMENALTGVDTVFHLAAALGASLLGPEGFARVNVQGTAHMLDAARKAGVERFIHFSSAGVLGHVESKTAASEDFPCRPRDLYDRTKLEGERLALKEQSTGLNVVILRPGWVYGPGDRRTFKLIRAIAGKKFVLVTRGLALQTPVYIEDLIRGTMLAVERGSPGSVYHLAGPELLTVRRIVDTIAAAADTKVPRWTLPLFPVKVAAWKMEMLYRLMGKEAPITRGKLAFFIHPKPLSTAKARQELGYSPSTDLAAGMAKAIDWYRSQGWL
jgi:nucleoside-diphosphate-sugar epimerase